MVCFFLLDNIFLLNPGSKLLIILLFSCYFLLQSFRPSLMRETVLRKGRKIGNGKQRGKDREKVNKQTTPTTSSIKPVPQKSMTAPSTATIAFSGPGMTH